MPEAVLETTVIDRPLGDENWSDTPPTFQRLPETKGEKPIEEKPIETQPFNQDEFVKLNFGFDNLDIAKAEIEKLKQASSVSEIEFANDFSKNAFEYLKAGDEDKLYEHLAQKRQIKSLSELEVNEKTAADIIKFDMKQKYQGVLNSDQIEFQFNKLYSLPKEPVYDEANETEAEFAERKNEWQQQINNVKMQLSIDAQLALPNIKKLQQDLILPDIFKDETPQLKQEDLQKAREAYLSAVESDFKTFTGYETTYENKEVGIPELKVPFVVDETEGKNLSERLKTFDIDGFVLGRWFPEGKANVKQLMSDVYVLENLPKILQKVASETGNQAISTYIEKKKNPSFEHGKPPAEISNQQNTEMDKLVKAMLDI